MRVDKEFKLFCFGIAALIAKEIILREFKKSTNIDLNKMLEQAAKSKQDLTPHRHTDNHEQPTINNN